MDCADLTFVVLEEHVRDFAIDEKSAACWPDARIVALPEVTAGAAVTALKGAESLPDGEPLLFNDCDHLFLCRSFYDFCAQGRFADARTRAADLPQRFAGLQLSAVRRRRQRLPYGGKTGGQPRRHLRGLLLQKDKKTYADACAEYLHHCDYKEFFVSGIYNVLADRGAVVKGFATDLHRPFGTPDEYRAAKPPKMPPDLRRWNKWFSI